MEFKQLQSFVEVVNYQSFTKASDKLFISQPTVSAHIAQLEEELNTKLILRTTKSISLTEKGKEVYDYATKILGLKTRMLEACSVQPKNIIHIGASTIPSAYILPNILQEYGTITPDTYFSIHQSDSQGIIDGLKEGLFDIGMIGMKPEDDEISCIPFCQDNMIIITPINDHFLELKYENNYTVKDLLNEPIIMRETGSGSKKTADMFLEKLGIRDSDINIIARINDQEAIKNMVVNGLGISIISELAVKNLLAEKRVLGFPLDKKYSGRQIYLIHRKDHILNQSLKDFLKFVQKKYSH